MTVTRSRDGVPGWNGDPSSWLEYRRAALWYVEATKWENRYLCGPRLATELSGSARASIANKKPQWLSHEQGVHRLLKHLQVTISEPVLPEVGNALRAYFRQLKRKRGESMTAFCVRHREEYEKVCKALSRMLHERPLPPRQPHDSSSRRASWFRAASRGLGTSGPSIDSRPGQAATTGADPVLRGSLDSSEQARTPLAPGSDAQDEDPWSQWYRQQPEAEHEWSEHGGSHWSWGGNWYDSRWQADHPSDGEDDEAMCDILPDVIQGWLLLEKAGLDSLEKSIIQSDIRSHFTLQGVENSLRAHWTDEQVRHRDGSESRHMANFEDGISDDEAPEEWPAEFFQDWTDEEVYMFQEVQSDIDAAWSQIQEGKRTLREARAKQKEVRLGRRFYGGKGRGKSQGTGGRNFPRDRSDNGPQGPCLRCGKAHSTRSCPQRPPEDSKKILQTEAQSEFIYQAETLFGDQAGDALIAASGKMSTHEAMMKGFGVLDAGATRTMGSITALEQARQVSLQECRRDNVAEVSVSDRPTFGFADSESAQCSSTVLLQLPVAEQRMKLRVHALDKGTVPVLLSIDTLKKMRAIVDYGNDEVVFAAVNPQKCVSLQTTATGHQILPLTQDFMQDARPLKWPIHRLGMLAEE